MATRHGNPPVGLLSAADLEKLEELNSAGEEGVIGALSAVHDADASAAGECQRLATAARPGSPAACNGRPGRES